METPKKEKVPQDGVPERLRSIVEKLSEELSALKGETVTHMDFSPNFDVTGIEGVHELVHLLNMKGDELGYTLMLAATEEKAIIQVEININ